MTIAVPIVDDGTPADQQFTVNVFWERGGLGLLLGTRFVLVPDAALINDALTDVEAFPFGPVPALCDPAAANHIRASCPPEAAAACTVTVNITQGATCTPAVTGPAPGTDALVPCTCNQSRRAPPPMSSTATPPCGWHRTRVRNHAKRGRSSQRLTDRVVPGRLTAAMR